MHTQLTTSDDSRTTTSAGRSRARGLVAATVASLILATGLATAAPASASASAKPNFKVVFSMTRADASTSMSLSSPKSKTVTCPVTHPRLISTGVEVDILPAEMGTVRVTGLVPNSTLNGVTAYAEQVLPTEQQSEWALNAYAWCATGVGGTALVEADSSLTASEAVKTASPTCPTGMKVTGGGAKITGLPATVPNHPEWAYPKHLSITALQPTGPNFDVLYAMASETASGTTASWGLHAYAICVNVAMAGYQVVEAVDGPNSDTSHLAIAECPPERQLIGLGFYNSGPAGTQLHQLYAHSDTGMWATATEIPSGVSQNWTLRSYAICSWRAS